MIVILILEFLHFPFTLKLLPILNFLSRNDPYQFYSPRGLERVENPCSINSCYGHITTAKPVNKNTLSPMLAFKNDFLLPNTYRAFEYWIRKLVCLPTETLEPKFNYFVLKSTV